MVIGCNAIDEHECCLYNTNICICMLATKQFLSALLFYCIISISKVSPIKNSCRQHCLEGFKSGVKGLRCLVCIVVVVMCVLL